MGIHKFWYFMEKTREIGEKEATQQQKLEEMKQYTNLLEDGIRNLKQSVLAFEDFSTRFGASLNKPKLSEIELKQKLFIDEFFDTELKEALSKDFKYYDLHDNHMNQKFIQELFNRAES
mmetsp:Transcript_11/g.12  ORF Transcript_11/g.12 Transcript_11/m.12 type:complete len:119 (-) Transcript_11:392-748(-)